MIDNIIKGLQILKEINPEGPITTGHNCIWFEKITPEESREKGYELQQLGWHYNAQLKSWYIFTIKKSTIKK